DCEVLFVDDKALLLRQIRGDECLHACIHRLRDRVGAAGKRTSEQCKGGSYGKSGSVHDWLPNVSEKTLRETIYERRGAATNDLNSLIVQSLSCGARELLEDPLLQRAHIRTLGILVAQDQEIAL